jgi:threonine dehydrogenase-like Zn-dependent dehydrogenase
MVEPLACACNALARAGSVRDKRVLVLGSGVMGLLITAVARRFGVGEIWVSDPAEAKHALARTAGAGRAVRPEQLSGERFDIVFEASGAPAAASGIMPLLEKMGIWVQVGVLPPHANVPLPPFELFDREISVIGSNSLADKFPQALEIMPEIASVATRLVTHRFSVWDFPDALVAARGARSVKTQLTFAT